MTGPLTVRIGDREAPSRPGFSAEMERRCGVRFDRCYQCMTCTLGCPVAAYMDHPPHRLVRMVQLGLEEEVLSARTLGICVSCETCTARCPNGIHIDELIDTLRHRAAEKGVAPPVPEVGAFHRAFLAGIRSRGKVFELGMVMRLKLATLNLFQDAFKGMKMFLKGKLGLIPPGIEKRDEVRRIFEETIDKKTKEG